MSKPTGANVEVLDAADTADAVSVLCETFADAPVMRFVLGSRDRFAARLEKLVTFFVLARMLREEPLLGIRSPEGLDAAALVSYPGRRDSPPELGELREELWAELGDRVRARYEAFGRAADPLTVGDPHIHLNMIGVRRAAQGRGLGRAVLRAVHEISARDPVSTGVSLVTSREANVSLYRHFGYDLLGRVDLEESFSVWGFFRPDGV
jgi:ribosomal protein S18 acetylase RimI-like enzyme